MTTGNTNRPEEKALLSLVQDVQGGKAWSASLAGWSADSSIPVCEWEGVTCRASAGAGGPTSSVVTEVSLPSSGLTGTIPTELGLLTELEVLDLQRNMLRGSIPQEVANLKKLTKLDLTQCFLTGTLPQRFESDRLKSILLANNAISGRFFQADADSPHLKSIREIRMENNLLTGELPGTTLKKMTHLETLSLSDNDLSGLIPGEGLGSLASLHHLYIDANHFVGPLPNQLAQVGKAQILELWVQDNALSGTVPASYARFDHLHDFYLDGNKLTGAIPSDVCGPEINKDFFENAPQSASERNYCDSIACPAGSVAFEGMYPCEKCPGGEAARLKNRYLGQQGKCIDYSERDVLKIFHKATTKGGAWSGVSDWADESKPVCDMTGVTCDTQGHVVGISLNNRGLQGHIPDEIGLLSFLETLDLSDNSLMGYVPSDLQWTSLTRLDISGNKIRGMIPPLLCKMEELNGNGKGNIFHCDRIACPPGTFNSVGFHHGADGDTCQPCYDDSPFIAQTKCTRQQQPPKSDWKESVQKPDWKGTMQTVKEASKQMGDSTKLGMGITLGTVLVTTVICWILKRACSIPQGKKYDPAESAALRPPRRASVQDDEEEEESSLSDEDHVHSAFRDNPEDRHVPEEEEVVLDDYSYRPNEVGGHTCLQAGPYRDFVDDDRSTDSDEDGNYVPWTDRSATAFIKEHQGIALSKREKLKKAVSGRVPEDLTQAAREAASNINVGARRRWHGAKLRRLTSDPCIG